MAEEPKQNGGTSPGFMQNQTFLYGFVALVFSLALPALIISCVAFQRLPSQCAASTSTLEEVTEHENLKFHILHCELMCVRFYVRRVPSSLLGSILHHLTHKHHPSTLLERSASYHVLYMQINLYAMLMCMQIYTRQMNILHN
jgi:hypothetical protein